MVITPDEMKKLEERASSQSISAEMLMQEAGSQAASLIVSYVQQHKLAQKATILAGKGNNGGDGYVAARTLLQKGFSVNVWQLYPLEESSLTKKERKRFEESGGKVFDSDFEDFAAEGVVIDAIFGTGFTGSPDANIQKIIQKANSCKLPIIALDIPSGINANTGEMTCAIKADLTIAIEYPKIGYFLKQAYNNVGEIRVCSIGLAQFDPKLALKIVEKEALILPYVARVRHKYEAGYVVGLAGSHGMAGASLLASYACLKSGAGIVHLLHPDAYTNEFTGVPLEVVRVPYEFEKDLLMMLQKMKKADALFIGPGLGQNDALLDAVFPTCRQKPCVIDADALSWIGKKWPAGENFGPLALAILTPHLGELNRLLAKEFKEVTVEVLTCCQQFVDQNNTHLVLKGAVSYLFAPSQLPEIVLQGDPGMATAGSGDVLTGVLCAFLAQKCSPVEAMRLGVFIHALAGKFAASEQTSYCMTASSIIHHLQNAFKQLRLTKNSDIKK